MTTRKDNKEDLRTSNVQREQKEGDTVQATDLKKEEKSYEDTNL